MSAFQFKCASCKYVTKKYNAWRQHLLEESHQIEARRGSQRWTVKDMEKAVVVFGLGFISASKADVLKHFADFSFVSNYIFWMERPDFCIIQFLTRKFRKNVLRTAQIIESQELFLRAREEITNIEWVSICPLQAQRVKIEVDLEPEHVKRLVNLKVEQSEHSLPPVTNEEEEVISNREGNVPTMLAVDAVNPTYSNQYKLDHSQSLSQSSLSSEAFLESDFIKIEKPGMNRASSQNHDRQDFYKNDYHEDPMVATEDMDVENYEEGNTERIWNENLEQLYYEYQMSTSDWELRNQAKTFIEKLLQRKYSSCVLIPFGCGIREISGRKKFNLIVDAYGHTKSTNCKGRFRVDITKQELKGMSSFVSCELENALSKITQVQAIHNGKIDFDYLDLSCGIHLNSMLLAQSWRLLNFFCDLDNRVRPLLIVSQHWALSHKLVYSSGSVAKSNSKNYFQPATLEWIVIFYLIHKNILPSINILQSFETVKLMYKGVDIGFCDDRELIKCKANRDFETDPVTENPSAKCMIQLAHDMFKFLGDIELQSNIISLNIGKVIPIEAFKSPDIINRFREWTVHGSIINSLVLARKMITHKSTYLFMPHPLLPHHNMTPFAQESIARAFTTACKHTAGQLLLLLRGSHYSPNPVDLLVPDPETLDEDLKLSNTIPLEETYDVPMEETYIIPIEETYTIPIEEPLVPKVATKKSKFESFLINITISKKFRIKAATVKSLEIKRAIDKEGLSAVWMKFLIDFNKLLWPVCYSIKITPLPAKKRKQKLYPKKTKSRYSCAILVPPFKGVLVDPRNMSWTYGKQRFYNDALSRFSKMLQHATLETIPNLSANKLGRSFDSLRFQCQIFIITRDALGRSEKKEHVQISFKQVRGTIFDRDINAKEKFSQMYKELWEMYCNHRLCLDVYDLH